MSASTAGDIDFVVLHPDGQVIEGRRTPGADLLNDAIRPHIPDMARQRLGSALRMWFSDTFTPDMPPNPLADIAVRSLGYRHATGWFGVVAVSAEEAWDGTIPSLPPEVLEIVQDAGGRT